jgi:hypothetical protein
MGSKSRETIYGASVRAAAERAAEARKEADRLAVEAWNKRMLGFHGPAQPSPALGDAINAGFGYLEVKCPWLQHAPDRGPRHRAATEGNAGPRTGTLHALPPVLRSPGLSGQAEPSGGAARDQDHGGRSTLDVVAGSDERGQGLMKYTIDRQFADPVAISQTAQRHAIICCRAEAFEVADERARIYGMLPQSG